MRRQTMEVKGLMGGAARISVIGPGDCPVALYRSAREVGRLIAEAGAVLVCGGLGGVMEAASRGAKEAGGSTVGILPGHDRSTANPFIDHAITTGLGEARNLVVVSSGDAVIAIGEGYGTLSEIGLAAKIGRPVIILEGWDLHGRHSQIDAAQSPIRHALTPRQAVDMALASCEPQDDHP